MGYQADSVETEEIKLANPIYWVRVKTCVTRGEQKNIEAALMSVTYRGGVKGQESSITGRPDMSKSRDLLVDSSVVDWNLTDDHGTVLSLQANPPSTVLTGRDFDLVWKRLDELNRMPSDEEAGRFRGEGGSGDQGVGGTGDQDPE